MRTKFLDPDLRGKAPRDHSAMCVVCAKPLKVGSPRRHVVFTADCSAHPHEYMAVHADDWPVKIDGTFERGIIGLDCAARLGFEWSRPVCA